MPYYISKTIEAPFDNAVARTRRALADEDFEVVNELDVTAVLKRGLGTDLRPYVILGACHPRLTFDALDIADKVGPLLPCNVIVQDAGGGFTEVAAIDPVANMHTVGNLALRAQAQIVGRKLRAAVARV
jgi:uncharacterized protein (DUF302 family)